MQVPSIARYGSALALGWVLWTTPAPLFAHVGHDSEFKGGESAQIMQSIEVDANTAASLGIKTQTIAPSPDGQKLTVPSSSLVDANGQKLVYTQQGTTYTPISVQIGNDSGDFVEIIEGNLTSGTQVVSQGATLLYSQALRQGNQKTAPPSAATTPQPRNAEVSQIQTQETQKVLNTTQTAPTLSLFLWPAIAIVGGLAALGAWFFLNSKSPDNSKFKE